MIQLRYKTKYLKFKTITLTTENLVCAKTRDTANFNLSDYIFLYISLSSSCT